MKQHPGISSFVSVARAIAEHGGARGFTALESASQAIFGHALFTAMLYLRESQMVQRLYSSHEGLYPVGGVKSKHLPAWQEAIVERREVQIVHRDEGFSEADVLSRLGVTSLMRVPVCYASMCLGTLNISIGGRSFDDGDVSAALVLAGLAVPLFAAADRDRAERQLAPPVEAAV